MKIAYLLSHPVQYQAPMLRRFAREPGLELTALYRSTMGSEAFFDEGFGHEVEWGLDLLCGYEHRFLRGLWANARPTFWKPWPLDLFGELKRGGYQALWVHGYGSAPNLLALLMAKLLGIRTLLRDDVHELSRRRTPLKRFVGKLIFMYLALVVDRFMAVGSRNEQYFLAKGIPARKIFRMPWAVDNDYFRVETPEQKRQAKRALAEDMAFSSDALIFLFAGKLQSDKRCDDLIRAFATVPGGSVLLIAGDGPCKEELRALANEGDGADIRFLGFKPPQALAQLYRAADVLVMPGLRETWGLVVNEAMVARCAVIVGEEIGCAPDLVRDGVNGFQIRTGDLAQLSQRLERFVVEPALVERMGKASSTIMATWSYDEDVAAVKSALA